ncbi:MAG: molybdopterin-dependent oxidoreductase, partial [Casimicrobiaceae bacterium]
INECWLSDKDRFSYEGLHSEDRLTRPLLRRDGRLVETDWQTALEYVAGEFKRIREQYGADAIGALASPHSTLEELHLAQKLVRGLGCDNIDFRLRQADFSADALRPGAQAVPWLGMPIADFAALDRVLVIGSFLRNDHPLLAHRLRQAAKKGAQVSLLHASDDELLIGVAHKAIVAPSAMPRLLAEIVVAAAAAAGAALPVALTGIEASEVARRIAASLASGERKGLFLGNFAQHHPRAAQLHALAQELARLTGATQGFLIEAANSLGGCIARALPQRGGMNARAMLESPRKAYLLLHAEPDGDFADPVATRAALQAAECVVALSPFRSGAAGHAHVVLPVAPFSETAGTFVNCEGRAQAFTGVAPPLGEARPAWKVLRVLGSLLGLDGFEQDSIDAVRRELPAPDAITASLSNAGAPAIEASAGGEASLERIADVPMYFADPLVRRADSLQKTRSARPPVVRASAVTLARLQLAGGAAVRVRGGNGEATLKVTADEGVPDGCVRIAAAHPTTAALGALFGPIVVEALQ